MKPRITVEELFDLPQDQPVNIAILDEVVELLRHTNILWGKDIAQKLGVKKAELNGAIRILVGTSLDDMVKTWRKLQAIHLLHHSECSYESIATLCGFRSLHSLTKFLNRETGLTPFEWREKYSNRHRSDKAKASAKRIMQQQLEDLAKRLGDKPVLIEKLR